MKKYILTIILFTLMLYPVYSQDTEYGGAFLELGVGGRPLGMGSAYVALSDDAYGFNYNPAGLALTGNIQAASMYANLFNTLEQQSFLSAVVPVFGSATFSFAWMRVSIDDIPRFLFDDSHTAGQRVLGGDPSLWLSYPASGSFSSFEEAFFLTFAKYKKWNMNLGWQYFEIPVDIGYGLNFKVLRKSIDDRKASGIGIDLGGIIRFPLDQVFQTEYVGDLSFGLNVQDVTDTQIKWDTDSKAIDKIYRNFKFGMAYVQPMQFANSQFTFTLDYNSRYGGYSQMGGEFLYRSLFAVRIGMNDRDFTTGAGIYFWKFKIDYAYQSHDLGNSHRVSILFGL
jgi:hypothetical protein